MQHQHRDHHVLRQDERIFSIRAEWEALSVAVCKTDQEGGRFEQVAEEGHAGSGFRGEELEDLGDFDGRGASDDTDTEDFRDSKLYAVYCRVVYVKDESLVASVAQDRDAQVPDRTWKVVRHWLQSGTDRIHFDEKQLIVRSLDDVREGI